MSLLLLLPAAAETWTGTAAGDGTGTLTGTGAPGTAGAGAGTGAGTSTSTAVPAPVTSLTAGAAGTLTGAPVPRLLAAAAAAGTATSSAAGTAALTAGTAGTGTGTTTADGAPGVTADVTATGGSDLAGDGVTWTGDTLDATGDGTSTADGVPALLMSILGSGSGSTQEGLSVPTEQTIWPDSAVPALIDAGDANATEAGIKFTCGVAGTITAIRFYKATGNTGTHVGHLWTVGGAQLAAVTFTGESASGWQRMNLPAPVAVAAGTTYVASYYAPIGHYSATGAALVAPVVSGDLTALASGASGGNGIYRYAVGGGFPIFTFNATNYWVDVVFEPLPPVALKVYSVRGPAQRRADATGPVPRRTVTTGPVGAHVSAHGPTTPGGSR